MLIINFDKRINIMIKGIILYPQRIVDRKKWGMYDKMVDISPITSVYIFKGSICQTGYKTSPKYMLSTRDAP